VLLDERGSQASGVNVQHIMWMLQVFHPCGANEQLFLCVSFNACRGVASKQ